MSDEPNYWVYHNFPRSRVRVHLGSCVRCREGYGQRGLSDSERENDEWLGPYTFKEAILTARSIVADEKEFCDECIKKPLRERFGDVSLKDVRID